ncbi:MAG: E3 binding domain-containing protein, partial [Aquabacterium sp.]|nr:E3 binding domain-containing protein [Aquabacterium sp.]
MALIEVKVPDIGDFDEVAIIEVLVKAGDTVKAEQSLITVESDKASMEIPSSHAGVVKELRVALGDKVSTGSLVLMLETADGAAVASAAAATAVAAPAASAPAPETAPVAAPAVPASAPASAPVVDTAAVAAPAAAVAAAVLPAHQPGTPSAALPHASPSIRKFARELGVPLAEVKGSGFKGRITQHDVQNFVRTVMTGSLQTVAQQAKAPAT